MPCNRGFTIDYNHFISPSIIYEMCSKIGTSKTKQPIGSEGPCPQIPCFKYIF